MEQRVTLVAPQECARVNAVKLHMDWRSVMRGAKAEELRGAVSSLAQRFKRAIDRRDLLIQARIPRRPGRLRHARQVCGRARRSKPRINPARLAKSGARLW